jgi:hypothetical protein
VQFLGAVERPASAARRLATGKGGSIGMAASSGQAVTAAAARRVPGNAE